MCKAVLDFSFYVVGHSMHIPYNKLVMFETKNLIQEFVLAVVISREELILWFSSNMCSPALVRGVFMAVQIVQVPKKYNVFKIIPKQH